MKTKELINNLQELDPSGELEVVAGGIPIYFVQRLPAYYDGALQILIQDKSRNDYNIIGYKYTHKGDKIRLDLMELDDCLLSNPDLPVDLSEVTEHSVESIKNRVENSRKEMREIIEQVKNEK